MIRRSARQKIIGRQESLRNRSRQAGTANRAIGGAGGYAEVP